MNFDLTALIVDSADLESESTFWRRLLGGELSETPTHHFLRVDGLPVIVIQDAPGHIPPQWPDGTSQQMHLDFATDDPAGAERRVLTAGGRRLRPADDAAAAGAQGSRVYASPAGHPFCIRPA
ncbi:VOC family protein [Streptomyces sp. NPDC102467]|uniref:VOC family protein n=1 Tax=Streptomyces sp. NPDC102467 TaxID=3366179 RepID=UPI0038236C19